MLVEGKLILTHGSDAWFPFNPMDYQKWDTSRAEPVHPFFLFCKHILGVNRSTTNSLMRGELLKFPLRCSIDVKAVKFYRHLGKSENVILKSALTTDQQLYDSGASNKFRRYLEILQQNTSKSNFTLSCCKKNITQIDY